MTDKQFYVIRNLLSWVVVALFLLVSLFYSAGGRSEFARFVGIITLAGAVGFTVMILVRAFLFVDPDKKKLTTPEVKESSSSDTALNLDGSPKQ